MIPLPIDSVLPELLARLREAGAVVLRSPTGAGKTTRVPPAILSIVPKGLILLIEPRRVAARAAARRMAVEDQSPLGERFGYSVRFDQKSSARTRVLVCTPGIVLRMLQADPFLEQVACLVFDEFHERGLETDLLLGMVRLLRQTVRPELQVVVMSATIDTGLISAYLGGCPTVTSEGRTFPVAIHYRPKRPETPWPDATASAIETALMETPGDVLAFLPGVGEIRKTAEALDHLRGDHLILPLYGELTPEEQDRALVQHTTRKIVLATNVAETSVTVEGITAVIDTGLARQMAFDAAVGMDRLELRPISRASADQRTGRAGRTQPGRCYRLWDEAGHRARPEMTEPEIRRVDLVGAVLTLLSMGETNIADFPWLEPPKPEAVEQAMQLLDLLGAIDGTTLTDMGQSLARYPVHPRLGRMLVEGEYLGIPHRVALAAALLSERDPFSRERDRKTVPTSSDVLDRVEALETFAQTGQLTFAIGMLQRGPARNLLQASQQLQRLLSDNAPSPAHADDAFLYALFAAYPDRLAKRRQPGDSRAKMVGGRGVKLAPSSGVESDLFVAVDVDAGGVEAFVRQASAVKREWLSGTTTTQDITFDDATGKLVARKVTRFADLILEDIPGHIPDDDRTAEVLAEAALRHLNDVLPDGESVAGKFLLRWKCLLAWRPELELPAVDESLMREHLPTLCRGRKSLAELRAANWLELLRSSFTYAQLQTLDREAPEAFEVPTGSRIALEYQEGRPPILAVRIQELFGLPETPRIAGGRVKVLLHLLSPNYRPQQVTDDLASFWANGYPQVRKDLRNRYPKHSWPDNPLEAEAIRGPKKRIVE